MTDRPQIVLTDFYTASVVRRTGRLQLFEALATLSKHRRELLLRDGGRIWF